MKNGKHYTREEELELLKGFKDGDSKAIDELAIEATRLALYIANKYVDRDSDEYPTYVSYAVAGFYKAINPYLENNREKEHKFTPYATWWMKKSIEKNTDTDIVLTEEE